jgi:hypothetical protein
MRETRVPGRLVRALPDHSLSTSSLLWSSGHQAGGDQTLLPDRSADAAKITRPRDAASA